MLPGSLRIAGRPDLPARPCARTSRASLQQRGAAEAALELELQRAHAEALDDTDHVGWRWVGERAAHVAAHDAGQECERVGADGSAAREGCALVAEHAALGEVEGVERTFGAAARARVEHRVEALEAEQLPEERRR